MRQRVRERADLVRRLPVRVVRQVAESHVTLVESHAHAVELVEHLRALDHRLADSHAYQLPSTSSRSTPCLSASRSASASTSSITVTSSVGYPLTIVVRVTSRSSAQATSGSASL